MERRQVHDERGQVVITRFICPKLYDLIVILLMHKKVKRDVWALANGYLGGATVIDWRNRTVLSVSLWGNLSDIYNMGNVPSHVEASRVPTRRGIKTRCGIYTYRGEWRQALFGVPTEVSEPLHMADLRL